MQFARCKVRLSGDMGTVIEKAPVSPAEVALLKVIHGDDAVFDVQLTGNGNDKTPHAEELARLRAEYTAVDDGGNLIIDKIFPGLGARLPVDFADIGIAVGYAAEAKAAAAASKPKVGKGKKKAEVETEVETDETEPGDENGDEE